MPKNERDHVLVRLQEVQTQPWKRDISPHCNMKKTWSARHQVREPTTIQRSIMTKATSLRSKQGHDVCCRRPERVADGEEGGKALMKKREYKLGEKEHCDLFPYSGRTEVEWVKAE